MCKKDITDKPTAVSDANTTENAPRVENRTLLNTEAEDTTDSPVQDATQPDVLAGVHQTMRALQEHFENQIARNQNQMKMFDAMYGEMKGYKENFLLDSLHKPVIKNLIHLYDSVVSLESQFDDIISEKHHIRPKKKRKKLVRFGQNLDNFCSELIEVLYRMDVELYETDLGTPLDKQLHRTVDVQPTAEPAEDQKVVQVHKTGFKWQDKVFRPAEVTIFRYTPPTPKEGDEDG